MNIFLSQPHFLKGIFMLESKKKLLSSHDCEGRYFKNILKRNPKFWKWERTEKKNGALDNHQECISALLVAFCPLFKIPTNRIQSIKKQVKEMRQRSSKYFSSLSSEFASCCTGVALPRSRQELPTKHTDTNLRQG